MATKPFIHKLGNIPNINEILIIKFAKSFVPLKDI
jgi:hypothetical protein